MIGRNPRLYSPVGPLDFGSRFRTVQSHVGTITFNSGNVSSIELPRTFLYKTVLIRMNGQLDITAAITLANEAPIRLIKKIEIVADGRKVMFTATGTNAFRLGHVMRGKQPELVAPATAIANNVPFGACYVIDFQAIRFGKPVDSYFDPRPYEKVELRITWGALNPDLFTAGTATADFVDLDILIDQTSKGAELVMFNKLITFDEDAIVTASPNLVLNVPRSGLLAGILFFSEVDSAASDGLIERLSLKSDNNFLHLDGGKWAPLQDKTVVDFQVEGVGPALAAYAANAFANGKMPPGYAYLDLTEDGFINSALNTFDLNVLQVIVDTVDTLPGTTRKLFRTYQFFEPIPSA